jgi:tetratricopeptide (TPR) repeat protein
MATQAEVHKCKSEYSEAWKIHTKIDQISANRDPYWHVIALLNVAEIQVLTGVPKHDVQQNVDLAKSIYHLEGWVTTTCYAILGGLQLRDKDLHAAQLLFEKCLRLAYNAELKSLCLEGLGNASQWGADYSMFRWTTIFLVYSIKCKQCLQVHKALQFCGDVFLHEQDEDTAITLFTVALEGFTYMDVHRSRAECMMRLGDISNNHGDQLKAIELWTTARPLFERSSQLKEVQCVDEKLAGIGSDVLEQHRKNIAHLVELNIPSGNPSPIEDEEQVEVVEGPLNQVVV